MLECKEDVRSSACNESAIIGAQFFLSLLYNGQRSEKFLMLHQLSSILGYLNALGMNLRRVRGLKSRDDDIYVSAGGRITIDFTVELEAIMKCAALHGNVRVKMGS